MNVTKYHMLQRILLSLTFFVLVLSLYFEYAMDMQPCPLCLMQRLCAFLLVLSGIFGLFMSNYCRLWILTIIQIIFAGGGLFFASRQIWLQSVPSDHTTMCMPAMSLVMKYFSWNALLKILFWGSSDCSETVGNWFGLSMPMWAALCFILMLGLCFGLCWALICRDRISH